MNGLGGLNAAIVYLTLLCYCCSCYTHTHTHVRGSASAGGGLHRGVEVSPGSYLPLKLKTVQWRWDLIFPTRNEPLGGGLAI